jgi:drug/metabolite transporter (DMT)-like permease
MFGLARTDAATASLLLALEGAATASIAWFIFRENFDRGIDNNLTRKVSLSNPLQIVELKGLLAGPLNVAIGLLAGRSIELSPALALACIIGFFGYGVSLALYMLRSNT